MNQKNDDFNFQRIFHYIWIILAVLGLIWLNYADFRRYLSSNPTTINQYIPEAEDMEKTRLPAVAGLFYAGQPQQLEEEVSFYLSNTGSISARQPKILIVPHAGYRYSATTAAKAYIELEKYKNDIKNVIIVGPSHRVGFKGVAVSAVDKFQTPLGKIAVNQTINEELLQNKDFILREDAHRDEHSIEVQLPFLQKVLKNFTIIPLVYGEIAPEILADALRPYLSNPHNLIIFSADLSHYQDGKTAQVLDTATATLVRKRTPEIEDHMSCGATGINAALLLAKDSGMRPQLLDMSNSGQISGDMESVVGYAAWLFSSDEKDEEQDHVLTPLEQEVENLKAFVRDFGSQLLDIAEKSLAVAVENHKIYTPSRKDRANALFDKGASFVTLTKNGELRGCIGTLFATEAIAFDVAKNTYSAALEDNRFKPVEKNELPELKLSISLLSDYERVRFSDEADLLRQLIPGIDGVVIRDGNRQGLFLPSVWKQLPDKQEFLNNLKLKAGLSPAYWSDKLKIYRFRTVEIK